MVSIKKSLLSVVCLVSVMLSTSVSALPEAAHIMVTGNAQLKVKPDMATISFQAVSVQDSAEQAKQEADAQVSLILSLLKKSGFEQTLLTRGDLQLRPEFEYIDKKRQQVGIKATRQLSYQLDDINKVNHFLDLLVKAKVNQLSRINYSLKDSKAWQLKARELAVQDSKEQAEGLAKSYQAKLGKIYSIHYQNQRVQPIAMRAMESDQVAPVYLKQDIVINEHIDAVFILEN